MPKIIKHSDRLGTVNKEVLDATSTAYATAVSLANRGFVVKGIMAGRNDPVIWLIWTRKCNKLESCTQKLIRNGSGKVRTSVALVDGCEVRWEQRVAA